MRSTTILLLALLAAPLTGGCGGPKPPPMAATPESSRAVLVEALDGWKTGKTHADLAAGSPPLYFQDDDLLGGAKLLDYAFQGDGKVIGTGYSYIVNIKVQEKDGAKTREKRVAYTAVTEPKHAVTREDRKP